MASNDLRRAAQLLDPIVSYLDGGDLESGLPTSALHQAVEAARLIEASIPSESQQPLAAKAMIEETVGDTTFRVSVTVEPGKTYKVTVGDQVPDKFVVLEDLRLPPLTVAGWTYRQWCLGIAVACAMGSALFGLYYWITIR